MLHLFDKIKVGGESMVFAKKLKQLRIKNEYSQEQLAELLNVSRQAVTKWEMGVFASSCSRRLLYRRTFGLSVPADGEGHL